MKLQKSKKLLWILRKKMQVILFSNDKYFTVDQADKSRTNRYISTLKVEEVPYDISSISQTKHPSQVIVFGLVASNAFRASVPPAFLPPVFRMGVKEYLNKVLCPCVLPWVQSNFLKTKILF